MDSIQKIAAGILKVLLPKFETAIQSSSADANLQNASSYLTNFIENIILALWDSKTSPENVDTHVKQIANEIINVYNTIEPTLVDNYVNRVPTAFFVLSANKIRDSAVSSTQKTNKNALTNTYVWSSNESQNLVGLVGAYQIISVSLDLATITQNTNPSVSSGQLYIEYFNGGILGGNPFITTIQLQTATANALQNLLNKTKTDTNDYKTMKGMTNTYTSSFDGATTYVDSELFLGFGFISTESM